MYAVIKSDKAVEDVMHPAVLMLVSEYHHAKRKDEHQNRSEYP
jgi:hypothetical protein